MRPEARKDQHAANAKRHDRPANQGTSVCGACGKKCHKPFECTFCKNNNPDRNTDNTVRWANSEAGKRYKVEGLDCMKWGKRLDGSAFRMESDTADTRKKDDS